MIQPKLAQQIIYEVRKLLDEDIIVVDTDGRIIASTDRSRIGRFHEGAALVSETRKKRIVTEEDEQRWTGVKMGVNLPIMFRGEVAGVIGITGSPEKVSQYGELLRKMTELFIQENHYHEEEDWHTRSLEAFVLQWMEQREWDDLFLNKANVLDIDLTVRRQVVLIYYPNTLLLKPILRHFSEVVKQQSKTIILRWGQDQLMILLDEEKTMDQFEKWKALLEKQLARRVAIGVGSQQPATELKTSFQQAERALHVAKLATTIVLERELTLELILSDLQSSTKATYMERTIAPIMDDQELMETLSALFTHNFSYKQASESIPVHINTLHYRLKKIEETTGLNPKVLEDQLQLYLAWRLFNA
ncbi:CdaR family transcriptional regulator [Bacillus sp. FJAT-42315]|uniref:CdaR family transcriptional regulator n=1 Tax=Bacillus sp. FJAT-42315 TaxID=2014077 RepID=UPI000C2514D1|nr:sugar diacid recognition domain-containing protein [Bacillus sp. FJAT-42315]